MDEPDYTRLHITPLTPSLLATLLPASILANARNISYHTIQTSPENSYGFVDLPREDAERLRKKFQGCFLRGAKVRIEVARPSRREAPPSNTSSSSLLPTIEAPLSERRRKRSRDELLGVDIGERHVKRGWTMPAHELRTKQVGLKQTHSQTHLSRAPTKSKYTTGPECLFKTVLPANMTSSMSLDSQLSNYKRKKSPRELVVHEFANTTKYATFLKNPSDLKKSSKTFVDRFVDGKGWFDVRGNLVEEACTIGPNRSYREAGYSGNRRDISPKQAEIVTEMEVLSSSPSSVEEIGSTYPSSPSEGACCGTSNTGSIEKRLDDVELYSESSESESKGNNPSPMENGTMSSSTSTSSFSSSEELERPLHLSSSSSTSSSFLSSSSSDSGDNDEDSSEIKTGPPEYYVTDARHSSRASSTSSDTSSSSSALSSSVPRDSEKLVTDREENDGDNVEEEGDQVQPCIPDSQKPDANNIQSSTTASLSNPKPIHPLASLFKRSGPIEPKPAFTFFPTESDEEDSYNEDQVQSYSQSRMIDPPPSTSRQNFECQNTRSLAPTPESNNLHRKIDRLPTCENEIEENLEDSSELSPKFKRIVERKKCGTIENVEPISSFIEKSLASDAPINVTTENQPQDLEQSDFQKWFWINQGQVNRAWKKRRKSVCKENKSRKNLKKINR
ncbi:hypothetical protein GcM1_238021 [Golovinomyces cichoracearum]|uniref:Suppressor protein srp40 protein n=1 Tax=Golovinomyces cichoracearum TaxID=62708 RepID=A0A420IJ63_9PEZI|nr:hypothetical protein GcM1_238021 [Golovinomyces cichoracearum]